MTWGFFAMGSVFSRFAVSATALLSLAFMSVPAQAASIKRDGFVFAQDEQVKIVVFRPDVHVGTLRVGGMDEPNAEWTQTARANMQKAMEASAEAQAARMTFLGDPEGADAQLLEDYRSLFETVASAVFQHGTMFDKLPTKEVPRTDPKARKRWRMDWTLGPGAARLRDVTGADYAMFVFTHDAYGDAGRKVAQLLMAGLFGAYVPAGVHIGYAGLVDLKTGDIVWFNSDIAMGGDPREADGATKRVGQLMAGFPQRGEPPVEAQQP